MDLGSFVVINNLRTWEFLEVQLLKFDEHLCLQSREKKGKLLAGALPLEVSFKSIVTAGSVSSL